MPHEQRPILHVSHDELLSEVSEGQVLVQSQQHLLLQYAAVERVPEGRRRVGLWVHEQLGVSGYVVEGDDFGRALLLQEFECSRVDSRIGKAGVLEVVKPADEEDAVAETDAVSA